MSKIINIFVINMGKLFITKLKEFLKEKDLIYFMIAVYVGTLLNDFLSSFTNSIIIPLINMAIPDSMNADSLIMEKMEKLGFVELRKLMSDFISLIIAVILSYYLIRFVLNVNGNK